MSKTPEEYFQEQEFQAEPAVQEELFTEAERAFIEKYVGLEEADILEKLGIDAPVETTAVPMPEPEPAPEPEPEYESEYEPEEEPEEELEEPVSEVVSGEDTTPESSLDTAPEEEVPLERKLQQQDELQLVSFFVGKYEYTMPIEAVQEVVRSIRPTQVPEAPEHLAGLVNLRGRVTPLVRLDELLGIERGVRGASPGRSGRDGGQVHHRLQKEGVAGGAAGARGRDHVPRVPQQDRVEH